MRFSVLLPTRNGGRLLRNCIASVLSSSCADMELVVSDNANTDETPAIVEEFRDDRRLRCVRQETALPVAENWAAALDASRGDYVVMIGDDDCLLPGYFERLGRLLDRHGDPECVVYNGHSYVFPGSVDDGSCSYHRDAHFRFGPDFRPGPLPADLRLELVRDMFRFQVRYPLNIQLTLLSRRAAARIPGGMFRAPFPDHYALASLLLTARTFVYHPERLVVVGVSPKSFGHFAYTGRAEQGMSYLGSDSRFPGWLPGNEMLNGMVVWLRLLLRDQPERLRGVSISRRAYVARQLYGWYVAYRLGFLSGGELLARCRLLGPADWLGLAAAAANRRDLARAAGSWRHRNDRVQVRWQGLQPLPEVRDIAEFTRSLAAGAGP